MGGNDVDMAWAGVSDIVSFVPTGKVKVLGIPDGSAIPGPNRRAHATLSRAFRLGALWKRHMSVAKRMLNSCPGRPLRARFADLLLAITTIVVTYLGAEAAFSFAGLRYVPLRLHQDLPEDIRVFAQSSKAGVVPHDPVLLLGDSYAQGFGDWLLETDPDHNGPFHSGHAVHALTGRDVVTLGQSGAGSAEGLAALPAVAYERTKHGWHLRLPQPSAAVVYFFEGNDLNNNMRFLEQRLEKSNAADIAGRIDRSISAYPAALFADTEDFWQHFPLFRFSYRIARRLYGEPATATPAPSSDAGAGAALPDRPNVVEVAGKVGPSGSPGR